MSRNYYQEDKQVQKKNSGGKHIETGAGGAERRAAMKNKGDESARAPGPKKSKSSTFKDNTSTTRKSASFVTMGDENKSGVLSKSMKMLRKLGGSREPAGSSIKENSEDHSKEESAGITSRAESDRVNMLESEEKRIKDADLRKDSTIKQRSGSEAKEISHEHPKISEVLAQ